MTSADAEICVIQIPIAQKPLKNINTLRAIHPRGETVKNSNEQMTLQIMATTKAGFFSIRTVILNQNGYETSEPAKYMISHRAAAPSSWYQYFARKRMSTVGMLIAITARLVAMSRMTNGRFDITDAIDSYSREVCLVENSWRSRTPKNSARALPATTIAHTAPVILKSVPFAKRYDARNGSNAPLMSPAVP